MRFRDLPHGLGFLKRWLERRAIGRCLAGLEGVGRLCDAPCGPGRLFPAWRKWSRSVIGVELSDPMAAAAAACLRKLAMAGEVRKGDVFRLADVIGEPADLVACVRFCYYFDRPGRAQVLRALAAASRRYVLVQYKTLETFKGRSNAARAGRRDDPSRARKHYSTDDEIRAELAEAGLECLRIRPIGWASDFTFVLAQKAREGK